MYVCYAVNDIIKIPYYSEIKLEDYNGEKYQIMAE
jgi:hypothetical protein